MAVPQFGQMVCTSPAFASCLSSAAATKPPAASVPAASISLLIAYRPACLNVRPASFGAKAATIKRAACS